MLYRSDLSTSFYRFNPELPSCPGISPKSGVVVWNSSDDRHSSSTYSNHYGFARHRIPEFNRRLSFLVIPENMPKICMLLRNSDKYWRLR